MVTGRLALLAVGIAAGLTGCSAPGRGEPESVFRREVAPVLEARCTDTVCHGARSGAEYRREKRLLPDGALVFRVDEQGRLVDLESAREAARGQINTAESAAFSGLLREPLSRDWGGLPHEGGTNFASTRDPGYRALRRWIRSETRGGEDPDFELTDRQEYFAREVQPALVGRNCMAGSCHDLTAFKPTFDPGLPSRGGKPRFSRRMIRRNYRMARHFLALDGHPEQSRLLRKGLPLNEGGIAHRGANRQFFSGPDSRAVRAIERWVKMERRAALKKESREPLGAVEGAGPTGLVYVRGPVESRSPFDIAQFIPGRDLYYRPSLDANDAVDLTGELHDGPADVRAPVVAPDGKHVAFAMRPSESAGFQIWETNLQTREADQLTSTPARLDSGHVAVNTTPVYGPENHVYFVSNRHDVRADSPSTLDYELFAYDRSDGSVERLTHTPSPEIEPTLVQGNPLTPQSAHLVFSYRRSVDHRDDTIGFSLPLDHH
ncbi:MAG: TolB family protein, partial [Bradymonadaceae bacterium]